MPAPLANCRPLLGASAYGNPGTPAQPLPANDITNSDYQFSYLQGLVGPSFKFNIFRDYHCVYGGSPCTAAASQITGTEKKYAAAGDSLNLNWVPSPDWSIYPVSASGSSAQQQVYSEIVAAAQSMKSIAPTPIYLTAWHEMNLHVSSSFSSPGCTVGGQTGLGTPQQFITAWRNVHDIFQAQGVTNVYWDMNYAGGSHSCLAPLMWPGDNYVNWVTWDTYSRGKTFPNESGVFYTALLNENGQKNVFGQPADFESKPWGIGEFGTCQQPKTGISEPIYFTSIQQAYTAGTYPRLHRYEIYANNAEGNGSGCLSDYDTDPSSPGGNGGAYDPAKQAAVNSLFATILNSGTTPSPSPTPPHTPTSTPRPSSSSTPTSTPAPSPSSEGSENSGGGTGSVRLGSSNCQVTVDGQPAGDSCSLDTTYLANGAHTVTVTSQGKTTTTTLNVHNRLTPFEWLRDFLFARFTDNHLLMNIGTVIVLLLPLAVLGYVFRSKLAAVLKP
jgi:hypothetical protein